MKFWWGPLTVFLLASLAEAQSTSLVAIYGMREKGALEGVIKEYEQVLRSRPNDPQALKALGIAYHNLGRLKAPGAVANAVKYLEQARALLSGNAEVLAYFGSARTMVARDSWNPITKVSAVFDGAKLIDTAVGKDPDNVAVRFVRANNSLRLPKFFNRRHYAKIDFQHLLKLAEGDRAMMFSPAMRAEIHFRLGELYKEEDQEVLAKEHWSKAVEIAPNSEWGLEAKSRL
jgi:tetratricopeptide (TPR) repeat protein